MAFQRNICKGLEEWKNSGEHKPLVIRGARQVGKTTVIKDFGKSFDTFIQLNLEKSGDRTFFTDELNPNITFQKICLEKNIEPKGKTLLFLDEIQNSPQAIALLRYFYEEMPELYVISAGSLLEIIMEKHKISFPVGRVEYLYLYPMTFKEFLMAAGETQALSLLEEIPIQTWAVPSLSKLYKTYTLVGGMPEAVSKFISIRDITKVSAVYRNLFTSYIDDVAKYASNKTEEQILTQFIEAAPKETGKRITFERFANTSYRSRAAGEALRKLQRAMLIYLRYPTTDLQLPLQTDTKRKPRLQFLDTGLVNFSTGIQGTYLTEEPIDTMYNGMIAEQITGQEILASSFYERKPPLFWVREETRSNAELDFILVDNSKIIPVEVKSGKTGTLRSLHSYIDQTGIKLAVRLYSGEYSVENAVTPIGKNPFTLINLPLFLAGKIGDYVRWVKESCH
ncbi:MAG: AAA family ATPase [Treponema sp.]|nr:AAA family ATPase [Treponema sp.]